MPRFSSSAARGFTLVELSIVLVILGLLVGGILTGQSLIHAAELRSISTDLNRFTTATMTFRDKYFALPGDMTNAVRYWGAQAGGTADGVDSTCATLTTPATGNVTCNGNGDGKIAGSYCPTEGYERNRFWQHLANAGLIGGSYSGAVLASSGTNTCRSQIPGVVVPAGRIGGTGYTASWAANSGQGFHTTPNANVFLYGQPNLIGGTYLETSGAALRNEDVYNIDQKMDDGKPYTGTIQTPPLNYFSNFCPTDNTDSAVYALTNTAIVCSLIFLPGF